MTENIGIQYKSAEPTDLDYRKAALDAAIKWAPDEPTTGRVTFKASVFEAYLRNGYKGEEN